jgi:prophage DNA circulation protein
MMQRWRPVRDERGQGVPVLILVVVVVILAVGFLTRTLVLGLSIDDKAEKIARTARGINTATDAILQLDQTTGLGESIKQSTEPLEAKTNVIVGQAAAIDGTASSINNSANSINTSVEGIGSAVSSIQSLARLVDRDARNININVRTVIDTADAIHTRDLANVIRALDRTEANARSIADSLCSTLGTTAVLLGGGSC